jgi:hypothetical protein
MKWSALTGATFCLITLSVRFAWRAGHRNPNKREQRRRALVNSNGRLGDALITGFTGTFLYYTYSVRGVQYSASQDIAAFRDRLPADLGAFLGLAHVKYLVRNPANSILLCEEWSGLRALGARSAATAG